MVASVRILGYGGSRQPLIIADFREVKKNLERERGIRTPVPKHRSRGPGLSTGTKREMRRPR